jgi:hypothetical protein
MAAPGFTGTGASITFATSNFVGTYRQIGKLTLAIEAVDSTTLNIATGDEAIKIPGDNPDPSPVTCRTRFQGAQAQPTIGVVETITITLRKETAASNTAASLAGTGFIMSFDKIPDLQRNQLNEGEIVFQFDGGTGPTYSAEA